ncbi:MULTISPECIES: winged helix-turn-helix transcriptional regulator [Subtercola]|uniref:Transcriptional regulator n=1 Tax=Subtercola vilae TaxID=2056433 RepID=A0A4T2C9R5_9MICO|nr:MULTISPECIES: helix-turn-helix domain-containing protein [Subtercola]MEA9983979.1 helix-turn-helix domain-containing protein [Subtercola sp. RTI3]TIH40950.1 transcriptional regulator [Subtercola vilae]
MSEAVSLQTVVGVNVFAANCPSRSVLDHVTSKWGVLVIVALSGDTLRWGELRRSIGGISEKMLAQTLRVLEADGMVLRTVQATIPPRVDYQLTDRGRSLADRLIPLVEWVGDNAVEIVAGRPEAGAS